MRRCGYRISYYAEDGGQSVAIGGLCDIDLVQYSEEIELHPDTRVGKYEKI